MKISIATTIAIVLSVALSSSHVSANNNNDQCVDDLSTYTSAYYYGRHYTFTRALTPWKGGPPPTTKCSGDQTKQYKNIYSADKCASTCTNADAKGDNGLTLLGYNYNCHTKKCDCILGNDWDDIRSTVERVSGDWACYEADSFSSPTPAPTPTPQCLPKEVTGNAFGTSHVFTRIQPFRTTTCNAGNYYNPFQADDIQDCANQCASKLSPNGPPALGSKTMIGLDYNCDSMMCTCLTGSSGTHLDETVQVTTENMACYFVDSSYTQQNAKQFLRANVIQTWD